MFADVCFKTNVFLHQMQAKTCEILMNIYDTNHRGIPLQTDFSISPKYLSYSFCERLLSGSFIDWIKINNFQECNLNKCFDGCLLSMKNNSVKNFRDVKNFSFAFHLTYFKKSHRKKKKEKVILFLSNTHIMLQKQGFVLESHYAVQELKHQSLITHKHAMKANGDSSIFLLRSHPRASEPQKFHHQKPLTHRNNIKSIHLC